MSGLLVALGAVVAICSTVGQLTGSIENDGYGLLWAVLAVSLSATGLILQRRER